jgi:hypothetical protein
MAPSKQPEERSVHGIDGPGWTEPDGSNTTLADRRIYIWHVMGFTDAEIAAHLDISVRDVGEMLRRCK